jgi:hypothetical protein
MNIETAFLNCHMVSVNSLPLTDDDFYLIDKVYHHNSLESKSINFQYVCIQIPEHEIVNYNLLYNLDYDFINKFRIPLIKRVVNAKTETWEIDLKYYENYKLQSSNIQSN